MHYTDSIETTTALFHGSKDVVISAVDHHLERVPETNISHDIERKLANDRLDVASVGPVVWTARRTVLFRVS